MKTSVFFPLVGLSVMFSSCIPVPVDMPMQDGPPQVFIPNGGGHYQGGGYAPSYGGEPWNRYGYDSSIDYGHGGRFSGQQYFNNDRRGPQSRAQW